MYMAYIDFQIDFSTNQLLIPCQIFLQHNHKIVVWQFDKQISLTEAKVFTDH